MKRKILQILCLFSLSITIYIFNSCTTKPEPVTAETALQSYLQNEDQSFAWNVEESYQIDKLKVYDLRITSQT